MALVGYVDAISRAGTSGWAVNPDEPARAAALQVRVNGRPVFSGLADRTRIGLAANSGGRATDSSAFSFAFEPPLPALLAHFVEVVDAASGDALPGGTHLLTAPSRDGAATPVPIVITSTGRAGTTVLMAEFGRNPAVIIADRYPYEIKQIGYFASALRTLAAAADRTHSAHPDTMLAISRVHVAGSNPYNHPGFYDLGQPRLLMEHFYESRVPARLATTFRELILEYYAILAVSQNKVAAAYFCEKGDLDEAARLAVRLFFPQVRELLMVRDPRDLLASAISFWKLQPDEALRMLRTTVPRLLDIHRRHAEDVHTLRYEDLLLDPVGSRQAISAFLGIDMQADLPAPDNANMTAHRTSADPLASIGRWRQDLSAEQIAACAEIFADYMAEFDYPAEAPPSAAARPFAAPPPLAQAPDQAPDQAPNEPAEKLAEQPADPPPPRSAGGVILAAEGQADVAALRAAGTDRTADGRPMLPVAKLEFGRGLPGTQQLGPGWSRPEQGYVWSNARQCHLALPPLREPGRYRVWLTGAPLLHAEKLPQQTVVVLVNGREVGSVAVRGAAVLAFDLPAGAVGGGGKIALSLQLPDATRPRDLGDSGDDRLLGFSLRWAAVLRADPA